MFDVLPNDYPGCLAKVRACVTGCSPSLSGVNRQRRPPSIVVAYTRMIANDWMKTGGIVPAHNAARTQL
jgi:hypothetical protein